MINPLFNPCPKHDVARHEKCGTLCEFHPDNQAHKHVVLGPYQYEVPSKPSDDGSNPKDRIGLTKPPLRLIPAPALIKLAMVMGLGASKYGPYNWREKKVRYTVYIEAAQRHILSALDGEEIDPESGQPHTAHAMACMAIILDAQATGNLVDDRPTPGVAAKLIAELTKKPT